MKTRMKLFDPYYGSKKIIPLDEAKTQTKNQYHVEEYDVVPIPVNNFKKDL